MMKRLGQSVEAAKLLEDVEIVEECRSIAIDAKYSGSHSYGSGTIRNPVEFCEVEHQRVVAAGIDRDRFDAAGFETRDELRNICARRTDRAAE